MQKAQNVINVFIYILVLTLCNNLYAQTNLNGTFCIDYAIKDYGECLNFKNDSIFIHRYGGDMGTEGYGKGEYSIIGNKLILNYNKSEPLNLGYHTSKIWTNSKDSINVNFKFFDFDSTPLPAVNIIYKDSLSKYGYSGVAANEKGIAVFKLKRDRTNLQFKISNLGFRQYEFSIDKNYNYSISVFLQKDGSGLPILNQIDTLVINKKRPKYFVVKNKNGSQTTWKKLDE
ncbi:hypothetical protein ACFQ0I_02760 [Mariniflexile aquimaris]|uniref:Uncharacterized protein n=1 Tax=Mariniflexile aquimaris TaxID=881009 RepID=A0ABW3BNL3_9FLAO